MLQSRGQNQKWPRSERIGSITLAVRVVPTASNRVTTSTVAHKWADWQHRCCRLEGPQRFKAGDTSGTGPKVGE